MKSGKSSHETKRFESLIRTFRSRFPESTRGSLVRAPGRVNIIGEHTDYNGYSVLPIAIERDIAVAVAPANEQIIEISNTDARFGDRRFGVSDDISPFEQGDWGNYVKAAVQGILRAGLIPLAGAKGMKAIFSGTIPAAAGLSSSSALVVVSALALLAANGRSVDRHILAELLPKAERFVGTESGGMDQAISLLAEEGNALKIDFFPLRTELVPIPPGYVFVVCNSLVDASKGGAAQRGYNLRVVECRLAAALLEHRLSQIAGRSIGGTLLSDLAPGKTGLDTNTIAAAVAEILGEHRVTVSEIARRLNKGEADVVRNHCTLNDGTVLAPPHEGFKLLQRYRHVISEGQRVCDAAVALKKGNISQLGRLMNESHASCRDDYDVSCLELEELVELGRQHGALGARLTGAGFGGCTVNLVGEKEAPTFINAMKRDFYKLRREAGKLEHVIFPCHPSRGASLIGELA